MKKTNKKGFTLVELVIVIAVIAILAAVLIPTFATVIEKSKKSSRLQTAQNALKMALIEEEDGEIPADSYIKVVTGDGTFYFVYDGSKLGEESKNAPTALSKFYTYSKSATTTTGGENPHYNYQIADMATGVEVTVKSDKNTK